MGVVCSRWLVRNEKGELVGFVVVLLLLAVGGKRLCSSQVCLAQKSVRVGRPTSTAVISVIVTIHISSLFSLQTRMQMGQADPLRLTGIFKGITGSLVGQVPYG